MPEFARQMLGFKRFCGIKRKAFAWFAWLLNASNLQ